MAAQPSLPNRTGTMAARPPLVARTGTTDTRAVIKKIIAEGEVQLRIGIRENAPEFPDLASTTVKRLTPFVKQHWPISMSLYDVRLDVQGEKIFTNLPNCPMQPYFYAKGGYSKELEDNLKTSIRQSGSITVQAVYDTDHQRLILTDSASQSSGSKKDKNKCRLKRK